MADDTKKAHRGFRAMAPATAKAIQQAGGRASAASPKHFQWSGESAREAGRLGGLASQARKRKAVA